MLTFFIGLLISSVTAIFEDQVGKFDWRHQYVGCPHQIHFDRSRSGKSDLIFISSEANVLSALKSTTGSIAWRQIHERGSTTPPLFLTRNKMLISLGRDGNTLRCWERESGSLAWEVRLLPQPTTPISMIASAEGAVFILSTSSLSRFSLSNGQLRWSLPVDRTRDWIGTVLGSHLVTIAGGKKSHTVELTRIDSSDGKAVKTQTIDAPWFEKEKCVLSNTVLACHDGASLFTVDVSSDPATVQQIAVEFISEIFPLKAEGFIAVSSRTKTFVYRTNPSQPPALLFTFDRVDAISAIRTPDGRDLLATFSNVNSVNVDELQSGKRIFSSTVKEADRAPITQFAFAAVGREFEFVTVGEDCRVDFFVGSGTELLNEWKRHEALSMISSVEMVDLPLSEAQAGIESEFIADGGNLLESLMQRLWSQAEQLRRACLTAADQIFSASSLLSHRSKSFTDWMASLRSASRESRKGDALLERDYFNLRKIVVAATLKPVIYGLDSTDGSLVWRLYLGKGLTPLKQSLGSSSVPLFIQRTTAHYQYSAQAAVIFSNKVTSNGVLVTFNPITGSLIERIELLLPIKRAELLPFANNHSLHPILVVDNSDKVMLYPPSSSEVALTAPVHLFSFDSNGVLQGSQLDVAQSLLIPLWRSTLAMTPGEKIVAIAAKPASQRVHSPGRVLGDRSVLYKYSNPNLVAVAVLDTTHSLLHIHLIDAINGYIIHSAKQNKASGPIHLIQCENWLTYSYWNEKGRRTEIAVIELYEGAEQTDELHFNSLTPSLPPVVHAVSQAYIFPQGISAMGVTETEQGLSTRALLIAMPFGGIYGVSKRMLDARRPLELTPELAEEMLIPYRPELPIASEDFINYNQTVYNIRSIKAAPSGLESTSLLLAYGLDLFFTRMTPSGTFDILKDDFDHLLISLVLVGLVVGSFICKKLGRNHALKQAWL